MATLPNDTSNEQQDENELEINEGSGNVIKKCYVWGFAITISLGMLQFGFAMASYNTLSDTFAVK
jgi:hypothetical protein